MLSWLKRGVEPLELDACIGGSKAPIDGDGRLIAMLLPGLHLTIQFSPCPDAARETLARQGGELNLGSI